MGKRAESITGISAMTMNTLRKQREREARAAKRAAANLGRHTPASSPDWVGRETSNHQQVGPATLSKTEKAQARAFQAALMDPKGQPTAQDVRNTLEKAARDIFELEELSRGDAEAKQEAAEARATLQRVWNICIASPRLLTTLLDLLDACEPDDVQEVGGAPMSAAIKAARAIIASAGPRHHRQRRRGWIVTTPTPTPITDVIFRKWPKSEGGGIFALFVSDPATNDPHECSSYEHTGQHGAASPDGCIARTNPATLAEYADLARELSSAPYHYNLNIVRRHTAKHLDARRAELARMDRCAAQHAAKAGGAT